MAPISSKDLKLVWKKYALLQQNHGAVTFEKKSPEVGQILLIHWSLKPRLVAPFSSNDLRGTDDLTRYFSVTDKPTFLVSEEGESGDELKVFSVEEGKSIIINLTATANPPEIEYKWSRSGGISIPTVADALPQSRLVALPNGLLNVSEARREDAGKYKVKASNSEGKTNMKFKLDVQYAPR